MDIKGYNMPEGLYYEANHYWVRTDGDILVMGMDDFAQKTAGDIVYVQIPPEGKRLTAGQKFAKVESGKWLGRVYAPVNGVLIEGNLALEADASLINRDCYGEGWLFKIRPDNMGDIEDLIHGAEAVEKWLIADIERYQ